MRFLGPFLTTLSVLTMSSWASAQFPKRFDMGPNAQRLQSGHLAVGTNDTYSTGSTWGWQAGSEPTSAFLAGTRTDSGVNQSYLLHPRTPIAMTSRNDLMMDGVEGGDMTFVVDAAQGSYHVVLYLGNLGFPKESFPQGEKGGGILRPRVNTRVEVNGSTILEEAWALTARSKARFENAIGGYRRIAFRAEVPQGSNTLAIRVSYQSSSTVWPFTPDQVASIMGLEIYDYAEPPIGFDHATRQLTQPGSDADLDAVLLAFNQHDYDLVLALIDSPSSMLSPLTKAYALAWHVGWMRGASEVLTPEDHIRIAEIHALLDSLGDDDPLVASLRDDLSNLELGARYTAMRSYTKAVAEYQDSLEDIVANTSAGALLLEQIFGDTLSDIDDPTFPPSPLYAKARYLLSRNMYGRNTYASLALTTPFNDLWLMKIALDELDMARTLVQYPLDPELHLFNWYLDNHIDRSDPSSEEQKEITWVYDPTQLPPIDLSNAWWTNYTDVFTPPQGMPEWAAEQVSAMKRVRGLGKWWIESRLKTGIQGTHEVHELGGGPEDDVEGVGGLSIHTLAYTEPEHVVEKAFGDLQDAILFNNNVVNTDEGYLSIQLDVEHSAEPTTDTLFFLLQTRYGNPRYVEFAMRTISNMTSHSPGGDEAPWTETYQSGGRTKRIFQSWTLGATSTRVGGVNDRDIPINTRAIVPGFFLLDYNSSKATQSLFEEYAWTWRDAAMNPNPAHNPVRPVGIFPSCIKLDSASVPTYGYNNWWENPFKSDGTGNYFGLLKSGQYHRNLYQILTETYRRTSDLANRSQLLEPLLNAIMLAHQFVPSNLVGSPGWTASKLVGAIQSGAYLSREELLTEFEATYPSLSAWIDELYENFTPNGFDYLAFVTPPTPPGGKNKDELKEEFENTSNGLKWLFPLGSSVVSYLDRIKVGLSKSYYEAVSGTPFFTSSTQSVTWLNPDPSQTGSDNVLDVALLVTEMEADHARLLIYNAENHPIDLDLQVWRRLTAGTYKIILGNDLDQDDHPDYIPISPPTKDLTFRGETIELKNLPSQTLQVLELVRVGAGSDWPDVQIPDLGISKEDVWSDASGIHVRVHNIGAVDFDSSMYTVNAVATDGSGSYLSGALPTIPAPGDFSVPTDMGGADCNPLVGSTVDVLIPGSFSGEFTIELVVASPSFEEITKRNNSVTVQL